MLEMETERRELLWQFGQIGAEGVGPSGKSVCVCVGDGSLIPNQTLETVFEEEKGFFCLLSIGGGRRVTELGVGFVAL